MRGKMRGNWGVSKNLKKIQGEMGDFQKNWKKGEFLKNQGKLGKFSEILGKVRERNFRKFRNNWKKLKSPFYHRIFAIWKFQGKLQNPKIYTISFISFLTQNSTNLTIQKAWYGCMDDIWRIHQLSVCFIGLYFKFTPFGTLF